MPYAGDLHVNQPLTNVSVKYSFGDLIGDQVFPIVNVAKESDIYYVYNREFLKVPQTARADGAEANEVNWGVSTSTYSLNEHALRELVTDRARANQDSPLDIDVDTTENLTKRILLRRERDIATAVLTITSFAQTHAAGAVWTSLTTTTNVIADINTATAVVLANSGVMPNTMVIPQTSWHNGLKEQPNIIEKIKYSERAVITTDMIASMFDINKVLVGRCIYDAAKDEIAPSVTYIWNLNTFIGYIEPSPGIRKVSAGYTFNSSSKGSPYKVKKWREEKRGGDLIEVSTMYQPKAVATLCGYVITATNA